MTDSQDAEWFPDTGATARIIENAGKLTKGLILLWLGMGTDYTSLVLEKAK